MNEGLESLREQIEKLQRTIDENHSMLVSIQRRARLSILISSIKWLIILGLTFGSFFFLQPYLDKAFEAYTSVSGLASPFSKNSQKNSTSSEEDGLIDMFRSYMPR